MNLNNWLEVKTNCSALLQHHVSPREEAAKKLLDLGDAPADERRTAEKLLAKCREERAQLEARLDRAVRQIAQVKLRMFPLEEEVQRQRTLRSAAAAMR